MLFKLSLRNIMRSIKDYAIYFFTLILGVVIFYIFNAIGTQSSMMQLNNSTKEVAKLMVDILSGVSVFIAGILGFLIIYASRFLIKRRNKEFAIYLTLGMSKRKISLLLFFETLFIGILSLAFGLVIGVMLSQLMSVLVVKLFEADMSKFQFVFSSEACLKTMLYFGIIYCLVILFNTFMINKLKIIDLVQLSRKSEKVRLKNPIICTLVFLLSATALGFAYYQVTINYLKMFSNVSIFWQSVIIGVVSTFFIFWSLSGLIVRIVTTSKKFYFRGLNSFTFRQISSKVNTTVTSMTVICLMLFLTICTLSSCLSIREATKKQLVYSTPVDAVISHEDLKKSAWHNLTEEPNSNEHHESESKTISSEKQNKKAQVEKSKKSKQTVEELVKEKPELWSKLKDQTSVSAYNLSDQSENYLRLSSILNPSAISKISNMTQDNDAAKNTPINIMLLSDYNKIAKLYHFDQVTMDSDQYFILSDFSKVEEVYNASLKAGHQISLKDKILRPKFDHNITGFIEPSNPRGNFGILVVADNLAKDLVKQKDYFITNYKTNSKDQKEQTEKELLTLIFGNEKDKIKIIDQDLYIANTKTFIIASSIGLQAVATFLGLYLGIIFLISSAAILALKELSEASDNREKYVVLRRLGANEKMIKRALFRQIAIFFTLPLILAVIHSIFGLTFALKILEFIGADGLMPSVVMTVALLVVIYGGYFVLTYTNSRRIISEKYLERR